VLCEQLDRRQHHILSGCSQFLHDPAEQRQRIRFAHQAVVRGGHFDDYGDGPGALLPQIARRNIEPIAHAFGGIADQPARALLDRRAVRKRARNGDLRNAQLARDVGHRRARIAAAKGTGAISHGPP